MGESSSEPLRGTIDLLVLRTLQLAPMHGWGITQRIQQATNGVLEVNQGSLYPALQRLEQKEWIDSEWRVTDNNRRAKYYRLTPAGRKALGVEEALKRLGDAAGRQLEEDLVVAFIKGMENAPNAPMPSERPAGIWRPAEWVA